MRFTEKLGYEYWDDYCAGWFVLYTNNLDKALELIRQIEEEHNSMRTYSSVVEPPSHKG